MIPVTKQCHTIQKVYFAPAENRTRGPTMATLDFTTKPLAHVLHGSTPGIEPGTSSTLKTNHTPRPSGLVNNCIRTRYLFKITINFSMNSQYQR